MGSLRSKTSLFSLFEHVIARELPYDAYEEETQLFFNTDSISFCLECSPLTGADEEVVNLINNLLSTGFPEECILQVHLFASTKVGGIIEKWKSDRTIDNPIIQDLTNSRCDYFSHSSFESILPEEMLLLRDFRLYFSVIFNKNENEKSIREILQVREQLIGAFKTLQMPYRTVDASRFISLMQEWLNPTDDVQPQTGTWNKHDPLNLQISGQPKSMEVKENHLLLGTDFEVRPLVVDQFPEKWPLWGMQNLIGDVFHTSKSISSPFYIAFSIYFPSQTGQMDRATVKSARWRRLHDSPIRRFLPITQQVTQEWEKVNHRIALGDKFVRTMFSLVVYAKNGEGDKAAHAAENLYALNGWKLKQKPYMALPLWTSSLPMSMSKKWMDAMHGWGFAKTTLHTASTQLFPMIAEPKGTADLNLLLVGRRGQVFGWDPFHNQKAGGNFNICVVGKPGSGKSVVMQEIQMSILANKGRVWVIDIGRSAQKTCELVKGQFIDFAPNAHICINPFSDLESLTEDDVKMIKPLITNMALRKRDSTEVEDSFIEQAILSAWGDYGRKTTITRIAQWLESQSDVAAKGLGQMLFPYTEQGVYGRLWNGDNNVNFDNPYVLLELDNLESTKDLQTVVLLAYLHRVSNALFLGDRRQKKICVMDEVWALLNGSRVTEFIQAFARRARKHNGSIMLGTQDISDFFSSQAGEVAYRISDWLIMLQQKSESIDRFIEKGQKKVDRYQEKLLKSLRTVNGKYSEMMIFGDDWYALGRLMLDPFSQILYSSKAQDFQAVQDLRAAGYSLPEAIQKLVKELKNG